MNTQNNTPASRNEEAVADCGQAVTALKWCAATLQAVARKHAAEGDLISMVDTNEQKSVGEVLDMADAALAAPGAAIDAREQEPFAYYVYIPAEQRGELVHDLDEATDDLTNCECEVTKLYAAPSEALSSATVAQPVGWAAVHFGGKRDGKIYSTCDTREQIDTYIEQVHQSNDSVTLTARPLVFADAAPVTLTDAELGAVAYKGFDDYWTEDSPGKERDAWTASAKAVLKAAQPCASRGCGEATEEQIKRAVDAWFGYDEEDVNDFAKRMRAAVAALSTAKSGGGATPEGGGE